MPSSQRYDKVATFEDDDEGDVGESKTGESKTGAVQLAPLKSGGGGSSARQLVSGGWAADPAEPAERAPKPPSFSPVARALGAALPAFYFAALRGLQLGTDVHVMGGRPLEVRLTK